MWSQTMRAVNYDIRVKMPEKNAGPFKILFHREQREVSSFESALQLGFLQDVQVVKFNPMNS